MAGERARGRAREGEIDPYGYGGWRGATVGSGRLGEAGGGSRVGARGEHAPSSSWQGRKTTGRRPVGWPAGPRQVSQVSSLSLLYFLFSIISVTLGLY